MGKPWVEEGEGRKGEKAFWGKGFCRGLSVSMNAGVFPSVCPPWVDRLDLALHAPFEDKGKPAESSSNFFQAVSFVLGTRSELVVLTIPAALLAASLKACLGRVIGDQARGKLEEGFLWLVHMVLI